MTKIVNSFKENYDVYVGFRRKSSEHYGNPFTDGAIHIKYSLWLQGKKFRDVEPHRRQWILSSLKGLRGKTLGCRCDGMSPCYCTVIRALIPIKKRRSAVCS